ncbi:CGNR zinc finger domain-containing protein [Sneathiella sp.]|jgi:predicted RNA-binding Zn ribbon-like protein|uniref:CGNR zinc finger domain-containing protein n=1 Tax=Sneathiella sp. TaxID=1964365 RepID=UPI0039E42C6B
MINTNGFETEIKVAKLNALAKAGVVNAEGFYTVGGRTAVDFANSSRRFGKDGDGLEKLEELLTFLKSMGHLHEEEASSYHMYLFQNPDRCAETMNTLRHMRARFLAMLGQASNGWPIDPSFIAELNDHLLNFKTHLMLEPSEGGYVLTAKQSEQGPEQLLYPIFKDIAEFIVSDQLEKVRQCASDSCDLFFVNQSRNGRRRWCSMSTCGNRAKVNAYLKRQET